VLLLLKRSGCLNISALCREVVGGAGGRKMKIKTIRLPDVETTMLAELQKVNKTHRDI
jgi:hypothetical protein